MSFPRGALLAALLAALAAPACGQRRTRAADGRADGAAVFRIYCVGCHGPDGMAPAGGRVRLALSARSMREAEIRAVVLAGRAPLMPAWRATLPADEIDAVARYVAGFATRGGP